MTHSHATDDEGLAESVAEIVRSRDRASLAHHLCATAVRVSSARSAELLDGPGGTPIARFPEVPVEPPDRTVRAQTSFGIGEKHPTVLVVDADVDAAGRERIELLAALAVATAARIDSEDQIRAQQAKITDLVTRITDLGVAAANADYGALAPGAGVPATPVSRMSDDFAAAAAGLTEREREILEHLLRGASNSDLAAAFTISPDTVKTHVKHILRKMGVANRAELIARSG